MKYPQYFVLTMVLTISCSIAFSVTSSFAQAEKPPEENYISTCIYRLQKKLTHLENQKEELEAKEKAMEEQERAISSEKNKFDDKLEAFCEKHPKYDYNEMSELADYYYAKYKVDRMDESDRQDLKRRSKLWQTKEMTESDFAFSDNLQKKYNIRQESLSLYAHTSEENRNKKEQMISSLNGDGLNLLDEKKNFLEKYPEVQLPYIRRQAELAGTDVDSIERSLKIYKKFPLNRREWPKFVYELNQSAPQYPKVNRDLDAAEMKANLKEATQLMVKANGILGKPSKHIKEVYEVPHALSELNSMMEGLKSIIHETPEEIEANKRIFPLRGEVPEKNKEKYDQLFLIKQSLLKLDDSNRYLDKKKTDYEYAQESIKEYRGLFDFLTQTNWSNPPLSCQCLDYKNDYFGHWTEDEFGMTADEISKNKALKKQIGNSSASPLSVKSKPSTGDR